jgi:uncharacterized protein (TIGR04255 family)
MTVFSLAPVPEVHLARAPLAKVLMSVQFSRTPALVSEEAESQLAESLSRYPVRRQGVAGLLAIPLFGQLGMAPGLTPQQSRLITFADASGAWQVSVSETSVALETTKYDNRDDFCSRAHEVLTAVANIALPPVVDRVGLRYIDRISGDSLDHINEYVEPAFQLLHGRVADGLAIEHSVSDTLMKVGTDERLQVRSGLLPAGSAFGPGIDPIPEPSWGMDLDIYTATAGFAFDPSELDVRLRRYAGHVYSFFRFATTDAFVEAFRDDVVPEAEEAGI